MGVIILGVDPGTRITGFGLILVEGGERRVLDYGCIRPPAKLPTEKRYLTIFNALDILIDKHKPHALSIETQYVHKNVQSAIKLGMARGVAILAATRRDIPVFEYTPSKAKKAVVGNGNASKHQIQQMTQLLLNLSEPPTPEDAADALALALCHANSLKQHLNV